MTEGFLIVLADHDFRERHQGTLKTAERRAREWLLACRTSDTVAELKEDGRKWVEAAYIFRLSDFPNQTYGAITNSRASCHYVNLDRQK